MGLVDSERALTGKGEKQAAQMAKWLRARMPEDAAVLVSPAVRAQQTARALTSKFKTMTEIGVAASAEGVLRAAGWPDAEGTVVVVGHQPTLGEAAALLLTGKKQGWALKKGAVVWVARDADDAHPATELRAAISPGLL
ncbi:MAG: phosphohistidine phosphatase, SixA [Betaproteobacteria bacterium]|nr:phosphohistidine phosphatase, SixA [Betaproteobacteria bacterium]